MEQAKSIHQQKVRVTHIGSSFNNEDDNKTDPDFLESIFKDMNSSIEFAHNNMSEWDAHKNETDGKNKQSNDSFKCMQKFTVSKKYPLMEKCQKTFKQVKHNRSVPKPRAHLSAILDFPVEGEKNCSLRNKKEQTKQIKKGKTKTSISNKSKSSLNCNSTDPNIVHHKKSLELLKQSSDTKTAKFKTTSAPKKCTSNNFEEHSKYDIRETISAANLKSKVQEHSDSTKSNLTANTLMKDNTSDSSDSGEFESFIRKNKIHSKKKSKKKENPKISREKKGKVRSKKTVASTISKNKKKSVTRKRVFKNQLDQYDSDSSDSNSTESVSKVIATRSSNAIQNSFVASKSVNNSKTQVKNSNSRNKKSCDDSYSDSSESEESDESVASNVASSSSDVIPNSVKKIEAFKSINSSKSRVTNSDTNVEKRTVAPCRYSLRSKNSNLENSVITSTSNKQDSSVKVTNLFEDNAYSTENDISDKGINEFETSDDSSFENTHNAPSNLLSLESETPIEDDQMLSKNGDCTEYEDTNICHNTKSLAESNMEQKNDSYESDIEIIEVISQTDFKKENCKSMMDENMDNDIKPNLAQNCANVKEIDNHDPVYATGICENTDADDDIIMIYDEKTQSVKQEILDDEIIFDGETKRITPKSSLIGPESERLNYKRKSGDSLQSNIKSEYQKIPRTSIENNSVRPTLIEKELPLVNVPYLSGIARDAFTVKPYEQLNLPNLIEVYKKEFNVYQTILTTEENVEAGLRMVETYQAEKLKAIREHIEKLKETVAKNENMQCNKIKKEEENPCSSQEMSDYQHYEPLKNSQSIKVEPGVINLDVASEPVNHLSLFSKDEVWDNTEDVKPELLIVGEKCIFCGKDAASACQRCAKVFFCSNKCGRQYWNDGHKNECGK